MYQLVIAVAKRKQMEVRTLFRLAYINVFNKDIPLGSLMEDEQLFFRQCVVPVYAVEYILRLFNEAREVGV